MEVPAAVCAEAAFGANTTAAMQRLVKSKIDRRTQFTHPCFEFDILISSSCVFNPGSLGPGSLCFSLEPVLSSESGTWCCLYYYFSVALTFMRAFTLLLDSPGISPSFQRSERYSA